MIEFDRVTKTFGEGHIAVHALADVSFGVAAGELVAVMGPSGSGKSTLLAIAGGLEATTAGTVLVDGRDLATMSSDERAVLRLHSVGYVFQDLNLLPGLTALENVAFPLQLAGVRAAVAEKDAATRLAELGVDHLAIDGPMTCLVVNGSGWLSPVPW